ncbi:DUF4968 domain-containing protein [Akkermansia glycaniphila]|uniref:glycoside hydrolase family 31 protein n=1 Tax=Akkermansia glycaniphila TaxID=1679444 RepID=UPI001C025A27|nr:TIM-barrel domain-containing protein [Akkermansia glycaniphila]MBT9449834.1 DUF4968 domain-containing protein [Akkermansia glycaniphila]
MSETFTAWSRAEWVDPHTLELALPTNNLRIYFLDKGIVRLRYVSGAVFENIPSYGVDPEYEPDYPELAEEETAYALEVRTPRLIVRVRRADAGLEFIHRRTNTVLNRDAEGMGHRKIEWNGEEKVWVSKHLPEGEHVFGLGDKPWALNLRGRRFEMWGADYYAFKEGSDPLYKNIPFYMGLNRGVQYGIFFDNTMRSYFDIGVANPERLIFGADGGVMDYYFVCGKSAVDTVRLYTCLTGLPPLPPRWALGYHQSKWSYGSEEVVNALVAKLREHRIPCDCVHLDIHHMNQYQDLTWDRAKFPDPPGMISRLEEQGIKVVTIVNPGIKINPDNYVWRSGFERNVFCRRHDGALLEGSVWPGLCNFPDYTAPRTRAWWAHLFKRQIAEYGVRGIWTDMNEPVMFPDKTFPDDTRHDYDGYSCSHLKAHNVYGHCMARATREGMAQFSPDRRPFVLSRSGYAGMQRYAATWTGDCEADWDNLKMANLQCQRLAASGVSFCGSDAGGFLKHPTPELFCRWMQMAAFHGFFRNHSSGEFGGQEPWLFGEEILGYVRHAIEERYRLMPYIYTQFYKYSTQGIPVIRPLALQCEENPDTFWRSSEFFLGDDLYIVPVHHPGETGRFIYIPDGRWYSYWTDELAPRSLKETWVEAPLSRLPVFVRGGAVISRWPVQQYMGELRNPPCMLDIWWAPNYEHSSSCFSDEGDGYGYLEGLYRYMTFNYIGGRDYFTLVRTDQGHKAFSLPVLMLRIHCLPAGARNIVFTVDGQPRDIRADGKGVYEAEIPVCFTRIEVSFTRE